MTGLTRVAFLSLLFFCGPFAFAQVEDDASLTDGKVHLQLLPYFVIPGISGDVTVKGMTQSINPSAGDIFSNLQFGFMARTGLSYNRFFVGTDTMYMGLGGANDQVNAGFDEWTAELLGGYRVHPRFSILTGVRYNSLSSDIKLKGPFATHVRGAQVWWDPFFGGVANAPLNQTLGVSVRFDVGGFGAGSRIAVNGEPLVNYHLSKSLTGMVGWKFFYQDYANSGDQAEYDVLTQGPMLGISMLW